MITRVTHYDNTTVGSGSVVMKCSPATTTWGCSIGVPGARRGRTPTPLRAVQLRHHGQRRSTPPAVRPSSVPYPNGQLVHFTYGTTDSMADVLHLLDALQDDSGGSPGMDPGQLPILGPGSDRERGPQQPDVRLESFFNSVYGGWDRFGPIIDQRWYDYRARPAGSLHVRLRPGIEPPVPGEHRRSTTRMNTIPTTTSSVL